jgi:hypothetical protein
MDFIERWLKIAPDSGDGSFERLILLGALAIIGIIVFRRKLRRLYPRRAARRCTSTEALTNL